MILKQGIGYNRMFALFESHGSLYSADWGLYVHRC